MVKFNDLNSNDKCRQKAVCLFFVVLVLVVLALVPPRSGARALILKTGYRV